MYFDTDILLKCSDPTTAGGSCSVWIYHGLHRRKASNLLNSLQTRNTGTDAVRQHRPADRKSRAIGTPRNRSSPGAMLHHPYFHIVFCLLLGPFSCPRGPSRTEVTALLSEDYRRQCDGCMCGQEGPLEVAGSSGGFPGRI